MIAAGAARVERAPPRRAAVAGLLALGGATALAVLVSGHPGAAAAPVLVAALAWAACAAPLRASAALLLLALLALDDSLLANGLWRTPLAPLGDLLRQSVRTNVPQAKGVFLTGLELSVLLLLGVAAWRRGAGRREAGHVASPRAVALVAVAYVACLVLAAVHGVLRGGSPTVAVWQTRPLLVTAGLFLVCEAAFRGPADHLLLGKIVVLAAAARALMAIWIGWTVLPSAPEALDYATDHGDSMLFSLACLILIVHLLERRDGRRLAAALVFLPVILLGMLANVRRTAWLQLALALAVVFLVARGARWRRPVLALALLSLPALALYGAAGWSSTSPAFAPVQLVRSVVDARLDSSTWNRQVENWNLAMSMRERPLAGRGFGHEWTEHYRGDDVEAVFWRYRAQPHNQLLGFLLFAGPLAFVGIWAPFALLVLLAARAYPRARRPEDRAAALAVGAAAAVVMVQCFSDLGPFFHQYWALTGLALAVGGKLATATGAWRG